MALELVQRQAQKQVATPAMMMEMSLLQLPIGELRAAVKKEVESNPALEVDLPRAMPRTRVASDGSKEGFLENVADDRGETLDEHILSELRMSGVEGRDLALAQAIATSLDRDGRFTGTYPDLVTTLDATGVKGVTPAELEKMRQRVMTIDPKGCGARDLRECYRAQLGAIPAAKRPLVDKAIDIVATAMEKKSAAGIDKVPPEAMLLLKKLKPFPGRDYEPAKTTFVTPDVVLRADGDILVDQTDVPDLRVSAKYVEMAKDRELDAETRAYAVDRVQRAREFREALIRRKETMVRIAEGVLKRQKRFLEEGPAGIVRMTMSELAEEIGCTISTVSRAAARKYVKTPRGVVPLRRFFALVDQAPIEKLREILASYPLGKRPPDGVIAKRLEREGVKMARRTVAKYRVRLGFV